MSNKNSFTTDSNSFENQNLGDTITPNIAEENTSELNTNNSPGAFSDPLKPLLEPVLLANTSQDFLDFNEMEETEIFTGSTSPDTIFVEPDPLEGDADGNLEINIDDVRAIFGQRNSDAVGDNDVRDIDRDGKITVLDARKLVVILRENNDRDAPDLNFGLNNDSGNNSDDFITSDPTISGTIEDLSQVTSLIARFEGTPLEDATEAVSVINEDGSFIINKTQLTAIKGSPLEDGEHTLYLQAKDKWGNKTQQLQVSFVLDTTPPQVFVPDLIANPQINSESQLVGTVDEEVASLTYSFAGQEAVEVAVDGLEFAQSFDLTNLESGTKTLTIIATDLAGNTTTQTLDVEVSLGVVDVTPPEIEAVLVNDTGSSTSDFITSNPTIMGIVNDESEIANLSAGFNDSLADITATLQSDSSFSLSEEILKEINGNNSLDDGEYTLNLIATDVAGNQGSTEISFTLDTTNPLLNADLLTDTGIDGDDGLTNDPTISGSVSDANAIASLTASLGDNTIDVTDLVDASGNFNLDATKLAEINNDNALEDREYTLELVATDIAGNESISTVSFILDTTAPELLVSSPAANSNLADGNQLTGTVNEDLASLVYQFDNQQVELELTNGEFSQELDLTGLADGQYSLTIIATDKAGNVSEETIAVNLDTTPDDTAAPIINAGLVTDTGSSNVDGITSIADIAGTVTDESAIASLTASLGGNTVDVTDLIDVDGNFNLNEVALAEINDGNALEDGTYTLELVATDAVGNVSTSTVNFTLDTTNPLLDAALVVDSGVDDGDGLTNNPAISGTVTINNAIDTLSASLGGNTVDVTDLIDADGNFNLNEVALAEINDGNALEDGTYTLELVATDAAGNESITTVDFILDTTAPELDITQPVANSNLADNNLLSGTVNEDLASLVYRLNDGDEIPIVLTNGAFSQDLDLTGLEDGQYSLTLIATDNAGNVRDETITVIIETETNPPILTVPDTQTVSEDEALNITGISVSDLDSEELTVTLAVNNGLISLPTLAGIEVTIDDKQIILNGNVTDLNTALAGISYQGDADFNGSDEITLTVRDGELEDNATIPVIVTPVNDAPIITVPNAQTVLENEELNITGTSITDIDVGDEDVQVTLAVNNGVLSLSETTGLDVSDGDGVEDSSVTFTGSLEDVNNAIAQIIYRSDNNFSSNDSLTVTVSDLGNTGAGGVLVDSEVINIAVASVNQPPNADPDKLLSVADDGNAIPLNINAPTDPDGDTLTITVDAVPLAEEGIVRLADNTPVVVGQTLAIAELQGLTFLPATGIKGVAGSFVYTVDDGQGETDSQTVSFNVTPVIVLLEGDDFNVSETETIIIPNEPSVLRFTYSNLSFDKTNLDFVNDAFEVALLDDDGNSLTYTIGEGKDSFFNLTEDIPADLAAGISLNGQTVTVNLAGIAAGTNANLIFRLVNNDGDSTTTVRINDIEVEAVAELDAPQATPTTVDNLVSNVDFDRLSDVSNSISVNYGQTSLNQQERVLAAEISLENIGTYGIESPVLVAVKNLSDPAIRVINGDGVTPDGLTYFDLSNVLNNGQLAPSEATEGKTIRFENGTGEQFTYELVVLSELNSPPVIESSPNLFVIGGLSYAYDVNATDVNGDTLTYELLVAPEGMGIDATTGQITWDTDASDIANYDVTVRVSDGKGGATEQNYILSVIEEPPNRPPVFTTSPIVDAYINQLYQYDADAIDPDLDPLTFNLILGPEGMRINSDTGVLEFTPPPSLILGDTVIGGISLPGERDEFTFSGAVGQQIYFDPLQFTGSRSNWNFDVFSPSGQQIVNTRLESDDNQLVTLTETGNYRIIVDTNNDVTGSYGFSVIDLDLTPVAPFDTVIEGQLSPGSEDDIYRFTGNAGQKLFIDRLDTNGSLNWVLYDAGNQVVTSSSFSDLELYLPSDGEYVLAIRGNGSLTNTIDYSFEIITPDEITAPMSLGSNENPNSVFGEIAEKGEEDFYTFNGTKGQRVYFDRLFLDSSFSTSHTINIVSPSGVSVFSRNFNNGDSTTPVSLPEDGTYLVKIDASGEATGTYSFNLLDVGLASAIAVDTNVADTLDVGQETHLYEFNATAGQRIYLDSPNNISGASWAIYNSGNERVASNSINGDIEIVLEATDNYILAIQGNNGNTAVDYNFEIITPDEITQPLALDTQINTELGEKGERDIYTFTGSVGQRLFLDTLIDRFDVFVTLTSPSGDRVISSRQMFSDGSRLPIILPEAGTYQLTIDGSGEATGDYGFNLIDVDVAPVLAPETLTNGSLNPGKSIQFYQFTGNEGDRIYFDNQTNSSGGSWYLFDRSNNRLTSASLNDFEYLLTTDGTYYLMLAGESDTAIDYSIQIVPTQLETTELILSVSSEIAKLGERDGYTFEGVAGQTIYFDPRGEDFNFTVTIASPSGQQVFNGNTGRDSTPITLTEPGTYELIVDGNTDTTGGYNFHLANLATAPVLSLGATLDDTLVAKETVLYQFSGTAGQKLEFDSLSADAGATRLLYAPTSLLNNNSKQVDARALSVDFTATLPVDGNYILALRNDSASEVNYEVVVRDISDTPVTNSDIETIREGRISVAGEIDTYTFTANAGTLVRFDGQEGNNSIRATLNNPDGTRVTSSISTRADAGTYLLTQTGDYTLEVAGIVGDYKFKFIELNNAPALDLNVQQDLTLNPLETKIFKFTGTVGQKVWLDGLTADNPNSSSDLFSSLLNSSGRQVVGSLFRPSDTFRLETLEADGEYYLVLQSRDSAVTNISFRLLNNTDAPLVDLDTEISGNFGDSKLETQLYRFNGTKGQELYFGRTEGISTNRYYVYDPAGRQIISQRLDFDTDNFTLPGDGEYILAFEGNNGSDNNYALTITTPEFTSEPLILGETVNANIAEFGERDIYTFTGTKGQKLWLDELVGSSNLTATLFSPSNRQVFSFTLDNFDDVSARQILQETGTYRLVIDGSFKTTDAYSFRLLDFADATPIELDTEISGNFGDSKTETQLYRFNGTQGQQLYFDRTDGDFSNFYYLYDPAGQLVTSQRLSSDRDLVELPTAGEYVLALVGSNRTNNNFVLEIVTPELFTTPLTIGDTVTANISEAGEQDTYTFEGTIGQQLWFDELSNNGGASATILSPSGRSIFSGTLDSFENGSSQQPTLTETGTYRVVIDGSGDTTNAYSFRLLDFADATPIELDTEISGNFGDSKTEAQLYRFNGTEGQQLYFDRTDGDFSNFYYLYNPAGQQVFFQRLDRDRDLVELPTDGEYTLVFQGNNRTNNNYALEIVTPELVTNPLTIGNTITADISEAGERDTYTFEGTVGQQLWLDTLTLANSTIGTLYAPSGQQIWSQTLSSDRVPTTLRETGTYTLVIDINSDVTEAYSFRFLDLADATPVDLDSEITADFGASGRETQLYRFNGAAGQEIYFDRTEGDFSNLYYLYDPFGQQVFNTRFTSDREITELPFDGEYTLVLAGNDTTNSSNSLNIVTPDLNPEDLVLGTTVTSAIDEAGDTDTYTFEGAIGQQLFFDALISNTSLDVELYSPSGNLVLDLTTLRDGAPFTLTEAGEHRLVIDAFGDTTGDYSFKLSDRAEATAIDLDTDITGTLPTDREVELYRFTGTQGTILNFDLADDRLNGASWVLYDPNNGILAQPSSSNPDFATALPSDGLYTLAIIGNSNNPVNYSFQVSDNSVEPIPLTGVNTTVTGTVSSAGDVDSYTFEASAGTIIFINQLTTSSSFNIRTNFKNPDGTPIFQNIFTGSNLGPIVLDQTGEYTLETFGRGSFNTGNWQFQILELPTDRQSANFNSLTLNSAVEDTLSPGNTAQVYSFDGTLGQEILFNGISGNSVNAYIYDPNGTQIFNLNNFRGNNSNTLTLTQDGIYHLVIDGASTSDAGFAFELLDFAFASEIADNLPVTGSLNPAKTTDIYRIAGKTDRRLFFDIDTNNSAARLKVYGVNNQILRDVALTATSSFDLVLPQDGEYIVYVEGNDLTGAIDYEFQVFAYDTQADIVTPGTGDNTSSDRNTLGLFPVQLQVDDGRGGTARQDFTIRLLPDPENNAPQIVSTPLQTKVGLNQEGYQYQLESIDPDGDILRYRLLNAPLGSFIDRDTGELIWFPTELAIAGETYTFDVEVSDGRGGKDTQSFDVEVFETLGTIRGVVFEDLNQNGIPDSTLLEGDDPDIFFVIDVSGSMGRSVVNWSTANLNTTFQQDLSPLDQELGSILALSEFLIAQGRGNESEIGIVTSGQDVIDMNPALPGIQVSTTPLADNNNNGIRDIREVITGGVGGGSSDTSGIRKAWEVQQILPGDSNIIFMSDGFINVDDDLVAEVKADGVNITAFGFARDGLNQMRRVDPDAVLINNPQEVGDIFSGFDPRYIAEPLLEGITVYLDLNDNGVLDTGEPQRITREITQPSILDEVNYYFSFEDLVPGTYNLRQVVPDGFIATAPPNGFFTDTITAGEDTFNHFFGIHQVTEPPNADPSFTSLIPNGDLILGGQFNYQATAIDPNPDALIFDLPVAPEGMVVNPETGYLSWTPTQEQTGEQTAILRVQDGRGGADIQYLDFFVAIPNQDPLFVSVLENNTPQAGKLFQYQASAIDPDGDALTYQLVNAPAGATVDLATGLVSWTPGDADLGEQQFQVKVSDGKGGESLQDINLNVIEATVNTAPEITSTPASQARVNNLYAYQIAASDIDGDPLSYELTAAPDGMIIDDRGRISWNPDASQLGEHTVEISVGDGQGGFATQSFTLNVNNRTENNAPSITSSPNTATNIDRTYQYRASAIDPDGDYLLWSLSEAPTGMVIDEASGVISWQPDITQVGEHTVAVRVTDTFGLAVIQTYNLSVTGNNTPPAILSIPPTRGELNQPYTYQVAASDRENDPLRYSLGVRPEGMSIDETTGTITWTPDTQGSFEVEVIVADTQDGVSRQTYTVEVDTTAINLPPTIDSQPGFFADVTSTYTYQVAGSDPEGGTLTYSLLDAPTGMNIDENTGEITWSPNNSQIGVAQVSVAVFDNAGLGAVQTYSIQVQAANNAPVINSTPVLSAVPNATYRYDVRANDPDREPISYSLVQAPEGMEIDELGRVTWNPENTDLGDYEIEIAVTDSRGAITTQTYDLEVAADTQAPQVSLTSDRSVANIGDTVTFQVTATDNIGVAELHLTLDGENIPLDGNGRATVEIDSAGSLEVIGTAFDAAGNTSSDTFAFTSIDPSDVNAPIVSINSVAEGDVISSPTDIIGTVNDDNLVSYTLSVAPAGGTFRELARGINPVTDDLLGAFDPSILPNDEYILRLQAQDAGGSISTTDVIVDVTGELKVGNYQLSFTDLTVPVSGIPIVLTRTYDSLNISNRDDFGFGWRMELRDTDLRSSVSQTGLESAGIYNPYFAGARVYITTPDGKREGFTFEPKLAPGLRGAFLRIWQPKFVPDAGVTSELTVENFDLLRTNAGDFVGFGSSFGYNPADPTFGGKFTLTTKEGIAYEIDGNTGDTSTVRDRNGNELTFTEGGIFSSTGQSITFERDAQNRITSAIDPEGNRIQYEYDAKGDLVSVTDREGNKTSFDYNDNLDHYLEEIIDPLGRTGARSEYDEKGRLVKIIDADGEAIELIHDPNNFVQTVKDKLGNDTVYEYDPRGNILNEIDAEGGITKRTYDANNNILTETDPEGNVTTFTYDSRGNVLTETDPEGNVTTFTYDSFNNVLTTTDPDGNTTANTYDRNGNLTSISGQANDTTNLSYNGAGNLTSFGDAGGTTSFEYDSLGNVTRQVDPEGNETTFTYDANGNQLTATTTLTTADGVVTLVTTTEYDSEGRVIKVTDPEGGVMETKYDAVGNRIEEIDALGRSTKFVYSDRGLLIETIYSDSTPDDSTDNPRTRTEYDAAGQITAEIDELGRKTEFIRDKLGRVVETIIPDSTPNDNTDNPRTRTEYDGSGRVIAEIDARGNRTEFVYDKASRRIATILADDTPNDNTDNPRFTETYNIAGRLTAETDALGNVTEFFYDNLGRLTGQEFADDTTVNSEFDEAGRLISRTDEAGEVTKYEYDAFSRLTAVINNRDRRTEYGYDEQGNLVSQKDTNGNVTKFEYDRLGRRIATELPTGQRSTNTYDAVGNIISTTDFNGKTTTYEYDERDRLIAENFPDGSSTAYTYTLVGQRASVNDVRGTTTYEYDAQDFLIKRIDPDGREIAYTYDDAGNRTSVEIASGNTAYTYDELNRLQTVIDPDGGITSYTYNDNSKLIRTEFPNGTIETREYDNRNRLTYIETKDTNDAVISSFRYELDGEGNRTQVTEHDGRIVKYAYDDLDRLTKEEIFDPGATDATRTIEYTYDNVGNRLSRVDSSAATTIYTYDNNDRLSTETTDGVATTYAYDNNGNTISKTTGTDTVTYNWDAENQLVGTDTDGDGTVDVINQYDADGVRVSQTANGEETRFLIDTNRPYAQVLEEYTDGGIIKVSYVHGNDLISQDRNGEQSFYHVDGLGSTRALSDENGLASDSYIYDAFGKVLTRIGDTDNSYLYTGEQRDSNLGLDYLRARYLDVNTGRFITRDPFAGLLNEPTSLHDYMYVHNNPVNLTDPSGLFTLISVSASLQINTNIQVTFAKAGVQGVRSVQNISNTLLKGAFELYNSGLTGIATGKAGAFEMVVAGKNLEAAAYLAIRAAIKNIYVETLKNTFKFDFKIGGAVGQAIDVFKGINKLNDLTQELAAIDIGQDPAKALKKSQEILDAAKELRKAFQKS